MRFIGAILAFSVCISAVVCGDHWALLVAGSMGYQNYRHQADVCHAYHILHNHGIPDERIIVMMYDDIADNDENPFKGQIINHPDGPNVYENVLKDYTGTDVRPEVFLSVLSGDRDGVKKLTGRDGKVVNSQSGDRLFVYFADHGAPGLIAFPGEFLYADTLHRTIKSMHKNKQYKQMVFYVEACESGSMFKDILEDNINVFATTAANDSESSYACYFDKRRDTYLGDLYSVNWMEDSDKENLKHETLRHQFHTVKKETNSSHVQEFGDLSMAVLKVADFQGDYSSPRNTLLFSSFRNYDPNDDAVPSEDVAETILRMKIDRANGDEVIRHNAALEALLKKKTDTVEYFKNVVALASEAHMFDEFLNAPLNLGDFKCYRESLSLIMKMCPGMKLSQNDYALRKLRVMTNMCQGGVKPEKIWQAIGKVSYETKFCLNGFPEI